MKIKIEIDVPEYVGGTDCSECSFSINSSICALIGERCRKVDFSRMRIKELEEVNNDSRTTD